MRLHANIAITFLYMAVRVHRVAITVKSRTTLYSTRPIFRARQKATIRLQLSAEVEQLDSDPSTIASLVI